MYEFILITLFVIGIGGLIFLLCFPVYLLIKEERRYKKRKHMHDEIIKTIEDAIELCNSMIEQEKKNEYSKRN